MKKSKIPLNEAIKIAEEFTEWIAPFTSRIVIAGSIRRKAPVVGDIELVVIPVLGKNLFGEVTDTPLIASLSPPPHIIRTKSGKKYVQFVYRGTQIDVFTANKRNWGYILAIRTGPAGYSKKIVTLDYPLKCQGGYLTYKGKVIDTPTEKSFFEAIKRPYAEPELRHA